MCLDLTWRAPSSSWDKLLSQDSLFLWARLLAFQYLWHARIPIRLLASLLNPCLSISIGQHIGPWHLTNWNSLLSTPSFQVPGLGSLSFSMKMEMKVLLMFLGLKWIYVILQIPRKRNSELGRVGLHKIIFPCSYSELPCSPLDFFSR